MRFVQARHYTPGRATRVRLIVVHTMESAEATGTALSVANWFASANAPQASAHFCIDASETVQCVRESDTAWAAPGANADGIQLEHAGRAGQGSTGWADAYSQDVLRRSAALAAGLASNYGIPIRHLTNAELAAGKAGSSATSRCRRSTRSPPTPIPAPTSHGRRTSPLQGHPQPRLHPRRMTCRCPTPT